MRFLQIHFLTSYPASLLNRDDMGLAKRIPFGGTSRIRISSQCLKRHWRTSLGPHALSLLDAPSTIRSRQTFEQFIVRPLIGDGIEPQVARAVTDALMARVLGKHEEKKTEGEEPASSKAPTGTKTKSKGATKDEIKNATTEQAAPLQKALPLHTEQVTVLGRPEIEYLRAEALAICGSVNEPSQAADAVAKHLTKERIDNLKGLKNACGLEAALFGRMVTSDLLARSDASVHVAHSFTVHEEAAEPDYFAAVDDLMANAEVPKLGSGHIGTAELNSGFFYGYVVVDVPLLVSNLEGCPLTGWIGADRSFAAQVVNLLVHLVATVSPGAKLGSTAPYAAAHLVLAEAGNAQPRTLANAFLDRVSERPNLVDNTYKALGHHLRDLDCMYGRSTERVLAAIGSSAELYGSVGVEQAVPLGELARWAASMVLGA